jgi:hypothetical protein
MRYFFHVVLTGDGAVADEVGTEFVSLDMACEEARLTARELALEFPLGTSGTDPEAVELADASGNVLFAVPVRQAAA